MFLDEIALIISCIKWRYFHQSLCTETKKSNTEKMCSFLENVCIIGALAGNHTSIVKYEAMSVTFACDEGFVFPDGQYTRTENCSCDWITRPKTYNCIGKK